MRSAHAVSGRIRSVAMGLILCLIGGALVSRTHAEIVVVPATSSDGASSSILNAGVLYLFESSGTYGWGAGQADAEWVLSGIAGAPLELYPTFTYATDTLDLLIDGVALDWMGSTDGITWASHTYSPSHVYRAEILGAGSPVTFSIADQTPFGAGYYSDNSGALTVSITSIPEPTSVMLLVAAGMAIWAAKRKRA